MKRTALLLGAALLCAPLAMAQTTTGQSGETGQSGTMGATNQTITGTIVSSDENQLVITTDRGERMTFTIDSNVDLSDMQPGSRIRVDYQPLDGGQFRASRVTGEAATGSITNTYGGTTNTAGSGTTSGTTGTTTDTRTSVTTDTRTGTTGTLDTRTGTTGTDTRASVTDTQTGTTGTMETRTGTTGTDMRTDADRAQMDTDDATARSGRLPATASPLPLIGLGGLVAFASGLLLRARSRRSR